MPWDFMRAPGDGMSTAAEKRLLSLPIFSRLS